jgi:pyridoxal phosphate enzyme (YggS family)
MFETISRNLLQIQEEIAPSKPRIIAVTKYFDGEAIIQAYNAGLRDFGESRVIEASEKIHNLPQEVRENSTFHLIGHLQTNKVKHAVKNFDYIHSVDSVKLAQSIAQHSEEIGKVQKVLIQVNNAGEEQKFGYDKESLKKDFLEIISLQGLEVVGLMCMAPFGETEDNLRILFRALREFRDELETEFNVKLPELSMGMSDDYEYAVAEGATMIRIGRKLFK